MDVNLTPSKNKSTISDTTNSKRGGFRACHGIMELEGNLRNYIIQFHYLVGEKLGSRQ